LSATESIPTPKIDAPRPGATVIEPRAGWQPVHFADLWAYRELLLILALRDVRVRYKQTVLGIAWALIQPILQTAVLVIFFKGFSPPNVSPLLFYFCGLLPWQLFSTALTNSSNSLISNQNLITKIYFPRLVIPISAVITSLVDFAVSFALLICIMIYQRAVPSPLCLLLPVFIAMSFFAALSIGLWLSALNVEFRDVRYVVPFFVQFWFFITPIIYPASHVPAGWKRTLLGLNPVSGAVEGFRWCLLGIDYEPTLMLTSLGMIAVLLIAGLFYFRRVEQNFADVI
jgi:lipopolysaccharide transport system permease protein